MFGKIVSAIAMIIVISCATSATFTAHEVSVRLQSGPVHNLNTGLDYSTIQAAIDAPETLDGHTILVDPGNYSDNLLISKSITLTGTDRNNTIIESYPANPYLNVAAHNVTISRFTINEEVTIENYDNFTIEGTTMNASGEYLIYMVNSSNSVISDNEILGTLSDWSVVWLDNCSFCIIEGNSISIGPSATVGIVFEFGQSNFVRNNLIFMPQLVSSTFAFGIGGKDHLIVENTIINMSYGIQILGFSDHVATGNAVYHNNFIHCETPVTFFDSNMGPFVINNTWDDGYPSGGNYYDLTGTGEYGKYTGIDTFIGPAQDKLGKDGIGDTPFVLRSYDSVLDQDNYPLMFPWPWERETFDITYYSGTLQVGTVSNSHVSELTFNWTQKELSFNATANAASFCIVSIPKQLLDGGFQVLVNDTIQPCVLMWNSTYTNVYFEYDPGLVTAKIIGERVTPIIGDINGDHIVNILDAILLSNHYLQHYP